MSNECDWFEHVFNIKRSQFNSETITLTSYISQQYDEKHIAYQELKYSSGPNTSSIQISGYLTPQVLRDLADELEKVLK